MLSVLIFPQSTAFERERERAMRKSEKLLPFSVPESSKQDDSPKKDSAMTRKGAYAALSYMACAVLLIMFNKAALSSYKFPCANVITLFQLVCSCLLLYAMRSLGLISFLSWEAKNSEHGSIFLVSPKTLARTIPLAFSYLLFMLVSMESVRSISIPMYTTLRRTTVAFTMVVEYLVAPQKNSSSVVGSVGIIILGAFIAGARDLSFEAYSYAIVFFSNFCTAMYLALISRLGKSAGLSSFGLMWCNGLICSPILLLWTFLTGDLGRLLNFPYLYSFGFQAVMLLSCIMAFLLNYTVFLNTSLNSALTQTVCGNLKDLFTVGIGWILFGGLPFDLLNVIGQFVGFLGSFLYAYCKLEGK